MCLLVQVADRKVPLFSSRNGAVFGKVVPHSLSNNDRVIRPRPLNFIRSLYEYMYNERCLSMGVARSLKHQRETTEMSNASHQLPPFAKWSPFCKGGQFKRCIAHLSSFFYILEFWLRPSTGIFHHTCIIIMEAANSIL